MAGSRAFLLAALKNFLANERDKSQRQKRGGQFEHFSLDWATAETQFQLAAVSTDSPGPCVRPRVGIGAARIGDRAHGGGLETKGRREVFDRLKIFPDR